MEGLDNGTPPTDKTKTLDKSFEDLSRSASNSPTHGASKTGRSFTARWVDHTSSSGVGGGAVFSFYFVLTYKRWLLWKQEDSDQRSAATRYRETFKLMGQSAPAGRKVTTDTGGRSCQNKTGNNNTHTHTPSSMFLVHLFFSCFDQCDTVMKVM